MKRSLVGVLSTTFVASIIPLAGCGEGDTGVPTDQTPGIPLDTIKTEMKSMKPGLLPGKEVAKPAELPKDAPAESPKN
jgi:hypothetical protein